MNSNRLRTVVEDLEQVLLTFMRKHRITHEEYRIATDLLVSTVKAGEESLLYDVFLEAQATDIGNEGRSGSPEAIEGPFYLKGSPKLERPYVMPHRRDEAGNVLFFNGTVTDEDGRPLSGAVLDLWHADALGLYSNIHPDIPDWNLRGNFCTDENGWFEVKTIVPPPYEIPKDGPTGSLLSALGRHFYRPAHLHLKVEHAGFRSLTSQLYFTGDQYLDSDVANAVRDGLVVDLIQHASEKDQLNRSLSVPFYELTYHFVLSPSVSHV
ncbi:dioxygenase [Burkholderia sp. Ac-20353]|uniref:dioxygenase family protein n=1 Tax=Burkholderia sp. Ac-20353 TaxID=2703894 RepID=UPI00197B8171|nr:dioxygenase [Burkholderia sp. Ac-20353]MBN3787665.1 catechol 1,2-dioxygenase [Burkholderia sp. Ac-20353]